jgi:hypothetical protein
VEMIHGVRNDSFSMYIVNIFVRGGQTLSSSTRSI